MTRDEMAQQIYIRIAANLAVQDTWASDNFEDLVTDAYMAASKFFAEDPPKKDDEKIG